MITLTLETFYFIDYFNLEIASFNNDSILSCSSFKGLNSNFSLLINTVGIPLIPRSNVSSLIAKERSSASFEVLN